MTTTRLALVLLTLLMTGVLAWPPAALGCFGEYVGLVKLETVRGRVHVVPNTVSLRLAVESLTAHHSAGFTAPRCLRHVRRLRYRPVGIAR